MHKKFSGHFYVSIIISTALSFALTPVDTWAYILIASYIFTESHRYRKSIKFQCKTFNCQLFAVFLLRFALFKHVSTPKCHLERHPLVARRYFYKWKTDDQSWNDHFETIKVSGCNWTHADTDIHIRCYLMIKLQWSHSAISNAIASNFMVQSVACFLH